MFNILEHGGIPFASSKIHFTYTVQKGKNDDF